MSDIEKLDDSLVEKLNEDVELADGPKEARTIAKIFINNHLKKYTHDEAIEIAKLSARYVGRLESIQNNPYTSKEDQEIHLIV